jgi:hypothetical protein
VSSSSKKREKVLQVEPEREHDGVRKDPRKVLAELKERGLEDLLREVAARHHVTPLEICGFGGSRPVPQARVEVWDRLTALPPDGAGWSFTRVANTWDLVPSSVSKPLVALRRRRAKLAKVEEDAK